MLILLTLIIALGLITALAAKLFYRRDDSAPVEAAADCSTCGGDNRRCGMDCMLEAAATGVEYYDDEELDSYSGRPSDSYTDDEAEQFRSVMLTMRQDEVAGWSRSLSLRGINAPDQIRDEMLMLIGG